MKLTSQKYTAQAMQEVVLFCAKQWNTKSNMQSGKVSINWINLREGICINKSVYISDI